MATEELVCEFPPILEIKIKEEPEEQSLDNVTNCMEMVLTESSDSAVIDNLIAEKSSVRDNLNGPKSSKTSTEKVNCGMVISQNEDSTASKDPKLLKSCKISSDEDNHVEGVVLKIKTEVVDEMEELDREEDSSDSDSWVTDNDSNGSCHRKKRNIISNSGNTDDQQYYTNQLLHFILNERPSLVMYNSSQYNNSQASSSTATSSESKTHPPELNETNEDQGIGQPQPSSGKYYVCMICFKDYHTSSALNRHMKVHEESKPFTCDECGKQFVESSGLIKHKRVHSGEKPYACDVCGKAFSSRSTFISHMRIHTGERPYVCSICSKSFTTSSHLVTHIRIHTGEKPYTCDTCGKPFSDCSAFKKHQRIHSEDKLLESNGFLVGVEDKFCVDGKKEDTEQEVDIIHRTPTGISSFSTHPSLIRKLTIDGEKPYACDICGKTYLDLLAVIKHRRIHTRVRQYHCEECGRDFTDSCGLKKHMRIHTGEKPYQCEICGKTFSTSSTYVSHKRIHTGDKPYKCEFCFKLFTTSSHLLTHRRVHTGEKPYSCEVCHVKFSDGSSFRRHKQQHNGEKMYPCIWCGKDYPYKSNLLKHTKFHIPQLYKSFMETYGGQHGMETYARQPVVDTCGELSSMETYEDQAVESAVKVENATM